MEQVKLPFRADIVGSFLRPERLKKARKDFESGLLSPAALQQIEDEEIEKFTEWMNDFQVTDYTGRSGQITTLIGEKDWLENSAKNNENRNFDIIDLNNDKLVGTIGLEHFNWIERSAVLGIFIGDEDYRSNGYGTESIKLLLEYGFKYLNLHSIRLDLLAVNERAHKCYLKCGFKDTGKSREEIFLNGKYYDKLHMDILEYEFEGCLLYTSPSPRDCS